MTVLRGVVGVTLGVTNQVPRGLELPTPVWNRYKDAMSALSLWSGLLSSLTVYEQRKKE